MQSGHFVNEGDDLGEYFLTPEAQRLRFSQLRVLAVVREIAARPLTREEYERVRAELVT